MKITLKLFFLSLFFGVTGFAMANTTTATTEITNEIVDKNDDTAPLRIRVCWTTRRGRRICVTVTTRKSLRAQELKVGAEVSSGDSFIIFSSLPKELNDSFIIFPSADSGFENKEGKLYLKAGKYKVSRGSLKIPVVLKK